MDLVHLDEKALKGLIDRAVREKRDEQSVERLVEMERVNRRVAKSLYEQGGGED